MFKIGDIIQNKEGSQYKYLQDGTNGFVIYLEAIKLINGGQLQSGGILKDSIGYYTSKQNLSSFTLVTPEVKSPLSKSSLSVGDIVKDSEGNEYIVEGSLESALKLKQIKGINKKPEEINVYSKIESIFYINFKNIHKLTLVSKAQKVEVKPESKYKVGDILQSPTTISAEGFRFKFMLEITKVLGNERYNYKEPDTNKELLDIHLGAGLVLYEPQFIVGEYITDTLGNIFEVVYKNSDRIFLRPHVNKSNNTLLVPDLVEGQFNIKVSDSKYFIKTTKPKSKVIEPEVKPIEYKVKLVTTEPKFKIGDTVEVTSAKDEDAEPYIGDIGVIVKFCNDEIDVKLKGHSTTITFFAEELTLIDIVKHSKEKVKNEVKEVKMEHNFKVGDIVTGDTYGIGKYSVTARDFVGEVIEVSGPVISLKMLKYNTGSTSTTPKFYGLDAKAFKLYQPEFKVGDIISTFDNSCELKIIKHREGTSYEVKVLKGSYNPQSIPDASREGSWSFGGPLHVKNFYLARYGGVASEIKPKVKTDNMTPQFKVGDIISSKSVHCKLKVHKINSSGTLIVELLKGEYAKAYIKSVGCKDYGLETKYFSDFELDREVPKITYPSVLEKPIDIQDSYKYSTPYQTPSVSISKSSKVKLDDNAPRVEVVLTKKKPIKLQF